ncbi:hypothetical protein BC343_03515 [Mucilaginibacter pedocola]|uniref:Uncharacterized protein n=2 Tax=Mucilaginibacter pedocola TaxID=1792845 RepID=A0A1S9PMG2_9SPHI|nr:hypothetical protein BC343_03515 [Mucilaginibacter pedocola]
MLILPLYWSGTCQAQSHRQPPDSLYLNVLFGDWFKNDTVDVSINDSLIFKGAQLTSSIIGLAQPEILISKKKGRYFVHTSESKTIKNIKIKSEIVYVELNFNNRKQEFIINTSRGRYIVFDNVDNGKLDYRQSKNMIIFE